MSHTTCTHQKVVRWENGTHHCDNCEVEFFHLDLTPGKIQVMEPMPTLRDQFAMAAMIADALSGAVIAVSYLAQGKTFAGEYPEMAEGAQKYFETADAMMKARKP